MDQRSVTLCLIGVLVGVCICRLTECVVCVLFLPFFPVTSEQLMSTFVISLLGYVIYNYHSFQKLSWFKQVISCSALLGSLFYCGVIVWSKSTTLYSLGAYMILISVFHVSEFLITAFCNPYSFTRDPFLINHSPEYHTAMAACAIEFCIEFLLYPSLKTVKLFNYAGFVLAITGELIRKGAMITAGRSFHHQVQYIRPKHHVLVTSGLYSVFRHPSYVGWFLWCVSTQIMLANPICLLGYGYVSWHFFNDRIDYEEALLLEFYGDQYREYQRSVMVGIPLISGHLESKKQHSEHFIYGS